MRTVCNRGILALCLSFALGPLEAQIYRCVDASGEIAFSDSACAPGAQQRIEDVTIQNPGWNAADVISRNRELIDRYDERRERERAAKEAAWERERQRYPDYEERLRLREREMERRAQADEDWRAARRAQAVGRRWDCGPAGSRRPCGAPHADRDTVPPSRFPKTPRAPMSLR